jgi:hypothetical protein
MPRRRELKALNFLINEKHNHAACAFSIGFDATCIVRPLSLCRKEWSVMKRLTFKPTIGGIASSCIINRRNATSFDLQLA